MHQDKNLDKRDMRTQAQAESYGTSPAWLAVRWLLVIKRPVIVEVRSLSKANMNQAAISRGLGFRLG